jgi:hypothetical protein
MLYELKEKRVPPKQLLMSDLETDASIIPPEREGAKEKSNEKNKIINNTISPLTPFPWRELEKIKSK